MSVAFRIGAVGLTSASLLFVVGCGPSKEELRLRAELLRNQQELAAAKEGIAREQREKEATALRAAEQKRSEAASASRQAKEYLDAAKIVVQAYAYYGSEAEKTTNAYLTAWQTAIARNRDITTELKKVSQDTFLRTNFGSEREFASSKIENLKLTPQGMEDLRAALIDLPPAFQIFSGLAESPSGTFANYSRAVGDANRELVRALTKASALIKMHEG